MKDLIVLVADLDTENVLQGMLPRVPMVCGTRTFTFDIRRHINRDPGCLNESADFLRSFTGQYTYALVVFDKEGSGHENKSRSAIEQQVEQMIAANGWATGHVAVITIDPEVENWMWINSPHVTQALEWKGSASLFDWLTANGFLETGAAKPGRPKEAMEAVLRKNRRPRSAAIYKAIAEQVSWKRCTDPAFLKMIQVLTQWFTTGNNLSAS